LKVYSRIKGIFSMVRSTISSSKACSTLCHGHILWWGKSSRSRLLAIWKGIYIYIYMDVGKCFSNWLEVGWWGSQCEWGWGPVWAVQEDQ
jgi:hypothetical protein